MSEQKRRRVQINIALTGELADAFERFEKELGRNHAGAARLILREYLS